MAEDQKVEDDGTITRDGGDSECEIEVDRKGSRVSLSVIWRSQVLTSAQVMVLDLQSARLIGARLLQLAADA
jgi:hypothetical protein